MLDPDGVTAAARMWDEDRWNDLHNPHYHTACPTARSCTIATFGLRSELFLGRLLR